MHVNEIICSIHAWGYFILLFIEVREHCGNIKECMYISCLLNEGYKDCILVFYSNSREGYILEIYITSRNMQDT